MPFFHENVYAVYLLIYRTLLITPDTLLGNFRCSNTMDTPVAFCSKYPDNTLSYIHHSRSQTASKTKLRVLQLDSFK